MHDGTSQPRQISCEGCGGAYSDTSATGAAWSLRQQQNTASNPKCRASLFPSPSALESSGAVATGTPAGGKAEAVRTPVGGTTFTGA